MARRPRRFGRYLLFESFARGGMATVCFGRVMGPAGFSRVVAIKRVHPHLAKDPEFVSMTIDEGRLAGRIRHPNVVPVIDVMQVPGELLLVMEYVDGLSLAKLFRRALDRGEPIPQRVATALVGAVLQGLHAAHEVRDERGELLGIVHRDVSPQNIIVGRDGLARVTDFGIALARERLQFTRTEEIKGKLEYMAREQLRHEAVDRRTDVYAASLVLWELLVGARPFSEDTDRTVMARVAAGDIPRLSTRVSDVSPELDALVARGLALHPAERFPTALQMATELERVLQPASQLEVAQWLERIAGPELAERAHRVAEIERWKEEASVSASDETLVGEVDDDGEGPTLVEAEPTEVDRRDSPAPPLPARAAGMTDATLREPAAATPAETRAATASGARDKLVLGLPLLAFVIGAAILVVVAVTRLGSRSAAVEPREALPPPSAAPLAVAPPPPSVQLAPSADAEPAPPPAPPSTSATRSHGGSRVAPTVRTKPGSKKPGPCDPPYTVDSQGVRVPKPECF